MAILKNGQISGLVGSVVGAPTNGVQVLRSAPRKRSKKSWSPKQVQSRGRFSALVEYWNRFRFIEIQQVWKLADKGKRGINLFISINAGAFDVTGELTDPSRLHFSTGSLPLPFLISVERSLSDPSKVEIGWDNSPEPGPARSDDELQMLAWKDDQYSRLTHTGVKRKAGSAVVQLPAGFETAQAVWISFGSVKKNIYSDDIRFLIDN
jgi:hypothetical protein